VSPQEPSQINTESDVWSYRQGTLLGEDISTAGVVGYKVEALDGSIGKVDDATYDEGSSRLIVDTGGWIFGKKVMLPAGVVRRVERDEEKVYVNRTKDQIKNAPEFEERHRDDDAYLTGIGAYYGPGGMGYQDWEPR
jgi:hypothetical protein